MRHFLFEEKEYRIKPNFRRNREARDSAQELARLLRGKRSGGGGGGGADTRQKCVVKAQYSNSIEAHRVQLKKYLTREGTDIDGGQARLFGTDTEEYAKNMDAKNFRIFLSPQSGDANLKAMAEKFIDRLELQTGYKLFWQGACHYNTAHPHAHLLINGIDKNGREVKFPRDVIKTFMREAARDICTKQLGYRSEEEMKIEKEREIEAPRWIKLDARINSICKPAAKDGRSAVMLDKAGVERRRVLARLETLRKLKLCDYERGFYKLKKNWIEDLKANRRYNMFLKAREELKYNTPNLFKVYSGGTGLISGRVTKIYRVDDDASDNHAVILESPNGKSYFIPLFKTPELTIKNTDGKTEKTTLAEGQFVSVKTYENQKGRLTPLIYKKEAWQLKKEIEQNNYSGKLAKQILENAEIKNKYKTNVRKT
ncbi:MAG: hypothetical protein Pg6A_02250 [Termitinemataceae bacterium]|nr:MAG: hypothetical protein Pg6A_02250 [Termitinemataceae bacterium]